MQDYSRPDEPTLGCELCFVIISENAPWMEASHGCAVIPRLERVIKCFGCGREYDPVEILAWKRRHKREVPDKRYLDGRRSRVTA